MKKFVLLVFVVLACKSTQSNLQKDRLPVIMMKKTECHGTCPVYTLIVYDNQTAKLVGERFLDLVGNYEADIPEAVYNELVEAFEAADFFSFKSKYSANITDLPTTYLSYSNSEKSKMTIDYYRAPPALKKLEQRVAALLKSLDWKK